MINNLLNSYYTDGVIKKLNISVVGENIEITNKELHNSNFELTEKIMSSGQLVFGSCESSTLKFRILNAFSSLKDKEILLSEELSISESSFVYGKYKIFSDVPTSDRQYRDIVAYDDMHRIINADVAAWYNSVFVSDDVVISLKELRRSFCLHFGLEEEEVTLCNDDMVVRKTIFPSEISGKDVLSCIGEINGCFPHISRNGKMQYVLLKSGHKALYPSNNIYPANSGIYPGDSDLIDLSASTFRIDKSGKLEERKNSTRYIKCSYEDYFVKKIESLQIRKEENDIGVIVGTGNNAYVVQNNFLVYGKSNEELKIIAENLHKTIKNIEYIPFECTAKGNPCVEVGHNIEVNVKGKLIRSYVFERTLKGINSIDTISAKGKKEQAERLNSTQRSIIELKGKANILTRTVDETRSYIYDTEQKLSSEILQQAGEIALRVRKDQIISEINLTPEQITISANKIDLVGIVNSDTFIANLINAEQLNAKFATVQNLNAVNANFDNLNASNLKVGTVSTSRLDLDGILAGFASKTIQGITIVGQTIRGSQFQVYDGSNYQALSEQSVTIDGVNYRFLGRRV